MSELKDVESTTPQYRIVTIGKHKLHGGRACWQAYRLADDADGVWLYTPQGSTFRSSDRGVDAECEVEGGDDSLVLVPPNSQYWMATWRPPQRELEISIEVCCWTRRVDGGNFSTAPRNSPTAAMGDDAAQSYRRRSLVAVERSRRTRAR